jgi:hypothetical protein
MISKLVTAALLLAGTTVALAQNAPPAGAPGAQGGGRPMMDPAARFKELDKNNDGKLSLEEFGAMQMGRMGGGQGGAGGPPPGGAPPAGGAAAGGGMMMSAAERFKAADKNNDGSINQEEFAAMMQMRRGAMGGPGGGGN